jgi:hypothetical protein
VQHWWLAICIVQVKLHCSALQHWWLAVCTVHVKLHCTAVQHWWLAVCTVQVKLHCTAVQHWWLAICIVQVTISAFELKQFRQDTLIKKKVIYTLCVCIGWDLVSRTIANRSAKFSQLALLLRYVRLCQLCCRRVLMFRFLWNMTHIWMLWRVVLSPSSASNSLVGLCQMYV